MKSYISWSGGKDSTACVILEHIHKLPKSDIVYCEVMYDHERNISGEDPEQIEWIYNVAIPKFKEWGYKVYIVRAKADYISLFYKKAIRSKIPERNGKYYGFPLSGMCHVNSQCKMPPVKRFAKENGYDMNICGIAIDEPKRLERLHKKENTRSYLEEYGLTEKDAYELCKEHGLLSPIYTSDNRGGGCWFCPNKSISYFVRLKQHYPHLYQELCELDKTTNRIRDTFHYNKPWSYYQEKVDEYINEQQKE